MHTPSTARLHPAECSPRPGRLAAFRLSHAKSTTGAREIGRVMLFLERCLFGLRSLRTRELNPSSSSETSTGQSYPASFRACRSENLAANSKRDFKQHVTYTCRTCPDAATPSPFPAALPSTPDTAVSDRGRWEVVPVYWSHVASHRRSVSVFDRHDVPYILSASATPLIKMLTPPRRELAFLPVNPIRQVRE
jgi:hypothetical protein